MVVCELLPYFPPRFTIYLDIFNTSTRAKDLNKIGRLLAV